MPYRLASNINQDFGLRFIDCKSIGVSGNPRRLALRHKPSSKHPSCSAFMAVLAGFMRFPARVSTARIGRDNASDPVDINDDRGMVTQGVATP
jgi:hypothetical protein